MIWRLIDLARRGSWTGALLTGAGIVGVIFVGMFVFGLLSG
jgi:hypothetical protein